MMAVRRCCAMDHSSRARREWCAAGAADRWSEPPLACRSCRSMLPAGAGEPLRSQCAASALMQTSLLVQDVLPAAKT